ncbi:MAG: Sugar phosphate isomerase/epimerase [Chloroflexota bacterium]|jgi:sugar phosphate isomerase/epimerase
MRSSAATPVERGSDMEQIMHLGFLTAAIADIEKAARLGFDAVELRTDAFGRADTGALDASAIEQTRAECRAHGVSISALAYYDVAFRGAVFNAAGPELVLAAYERVFDAAEALGVQTIASMSGFDAARDWDANVQLFADRFGPVAQHAERRGLRLAFENWMGFGGRLPFKPVNMGGSPDTWDAWFAAVPSRAIGIEFDPSHLAWQGIDHMRALYEYRDRVYHVHAKDVELFPERRYRGGVNGNAFRFRIPGYGMISWATFVAALREIGYSGGVAIEHEDEVFSGDRFDEGLVRGRQVLRPLVHPS